jgi:hypothetical protein
MKGNALQAIQGKKSQKNLDPPPYWTVYQINTSNLLRRKI